RPGYVVGPWGNIGLSRPNDSLIKRCCGACAFRRNLPGRRPFRARPRRSKTGLEELHDLANTALDVRLGLLAAQKLQHPVSTDRGMLSHAEHAMQAPVEGLLVQVGTAFAQQGHVARGAVTENIANDLAHLRSRIAERASQQPPEHARALV